MSDSTQYLELASTPTNNENLHLKELVVIRWTCWMAEKMAMALEHQAPANMPHSSQVGQLIRQLNDCAEHVAQYALEGLPLETRAGFLERDVAMLLAIFDKHADWLLTGPGHLPSRDVMRVWVS